MKSENKKENQTSGKERNLSNDKTSPDVGAD